ncbi:MAG: hypothetical protein KY455_02875 [Euryarchaeota archaeon]|nr:hypothetical protein [Euryarchaeota archaeon]
MEHLQQHRTENEQIETIAAARTAYSALGTLLVGALLVQVFLAGAGIFSNPAWLRHHSWFVHLIEPIPLLLVLVAAIGRLGRFQIVAPLLMTVGIGLQYVFAHAVENVLTGLHTVNAFFVLWLAIEAVRRTGRSS